MLTNINNKKERERRAINETIHLGNNLRSRLR